MVTSEWNGQHIRLDEAGFLVDLNDWNEEVAAALARKEGIDALSAEQLDIIRFMREYFFFCLLFHKQKNVCRIGHQLKE